MINIYEVNETNNMIEHEKLDVRTITMGISLLDCADSDLDAVNEKIYKKDHHSGKRPGFLQEKILKEILASLL